MSKLQTKVYPAAWLVAKASLMLPLIAWAPAPA
jgi:hypothetical protein